MSAENRRILHVLPLSKDVEELYRNHGTFHEGDSGLDLFVVQDETIKAGETAFLKLGIKCAAYDESNASISWLAFPRSSISKTPLRLSNSIGLIDAGYRGEIIACVDNIKSVDHTVRKGERLIQAVFADLKPFTFKIVDSLSETSRGEGGFGSTSKTDSSTAQPSDGAPTEESNAMADDESAKKVEGQKKADVEGECSTKKENQAPTQGPTESKKRSSETTLEGQVKKARSESSSESVNA